MGGAYATFEEDEKGSLEKGKLADIAVLSQDPLTCDLDKLRETKAEMTIVGGKVVLSERSPSLRARRSNLAVIARRGDCFVAGCSQ